VAFDDKKIKYYSTGVPIVTKVTLTNTQLPQALAVGQIKPSTRTVKPFTFNKVRYTFPAKTANYLQFPGTASLKCALKRKDSTSWVPTGSGVWQFIPASTSGSSLHRYAMFV